MKKYPDINLGKIGDEGLFDVDVNEVADSLYEDLNFLDVRELWDSSGSTRYGYVEPDERAGEMIEEVLDSYFDDLKKYVKLSKNKEAMLFCKGMLKGLYKFDKESTAEFSDWVVEVVYEFIPMVYGKFKEICEGDLEDARVFARELGVEVF